MDSRGNVFYTDLSHVWKIAPGGAKSIAVRGVHTHELYIDREDNLYGEHLWYEGDRTKKWGHRVWKLAADGKLSDVIPAREGFLQELQLRARRPREHVLGGTRRADDASKTHAIRTNRNRGTSRHFSRHPLDDLYDRGHDIPDRRSRPAPRRLRRDGPHRRARPRGAKALTIPGRRPSYSDGTMDRHGRRNVFVAVYGARLVKKIDRDGKVTIAARSQAPWSPTGGLAVPNGDLWLLEYSITNAARARHIQRDGKENIY